jgi:hypothetical protein
MTSKVDNKDKLLKKEKHIYSITKFNKNDVTSALMFRRIFCIKLECSN